MRKAVILPLFLFLVLAACGPAEPEKEMVRYSNLAADAGFDTVLIYTEFGYDNDQMASHFKTAEEIFRSCDAEFDIYNDHEGVSGLKEINDNAGKGPVKVSSTLIDLLQKAKQFYDLSGGKFDITIGAPLKIWHEYREKGITANEAGKEGEIPSAEELEAVRACRGWDKVIVNEKDQTVQITDPCVRLDAGGIAKGYAAEVMGQQLEDSVEVCGNINAGGNVRTIGTKQDGTDWNVGIRDPQGDGSSYLLIVSGGGSMSFVTSGDYERFYTGPGGKKYHHIIDPDTLQPSSLYRSVTVITKDSAAADALSTSLFTMTAEEGKKMLAAYTAESGDAAEAVWIMDLSAAQPGAEEHKGMAVIYTDGLKGKISE